MTRVLLTLLALLVAVPSYAAKIIPDKDLTYLGAFRVAKDREDSNGRWFGGTSGFMAFNPTGNGGAGSLILAGQEDSASWVGEMSIPASFGTGNVSTLPQATGLQNFADVRGALGTVQTGDLRQQTYGLTVIPAHGSQTSPKLYWLSIYNYNPANTGTPNYATALGYSDLNFSSLNAAGEWNLSGRTPANYAWYALTLPTAWADSYVGGQYLGVGRDRINQSTEGWGPSLYTAAPWSQGNPPANGTQLTNTKLLGYGQANPVSVNYAHGDGSRGAAWATIGGKSAFIMAYNKGIRSAVDAPVPGPYPFEDYKSGLFLGLPEMTGTGSYSYSASQGDYKSYPWFGTLLFYDTNELAQVAQGSKTPAQVKPYATFNIEKYLKKQQGKVPSADMSVGGITYDAATQRLYVQELTADGLYPIVHVFQLQNTGSALPSSPPTIPANISHSGATVTWSASTGFDGSSNGISYAIFKRFPAYTTTWAISNCTGLGGTVIGGNCSFPAMWRPVSGTTQTSWFDPGYVSGDSYNVVAYDSYMTPSNVLNTSGDPPPVETPPAVGTGSRSIGKFRGKVR